MHLDALGVVLVCEVSMGHSSIKMLTTVFFFFKQKTAYEIMPSLVGSEMCIRDSLLFGKW